MGMLKKAGLILGGLVALYLVVIVIEAAVLVTKGDGNATASTASTAPSAPTPTVTPAPEPAVPEPRAITVQEHLQYIDQWRTRMRNCLHVVSRISGRGLEVRSELVELARDSMDGTKQGACTHVVELPEVSDAVFSRLDENDRNNWFNRYRAMNPDVFPSAKLCDPGIQTATKMMLTYIDINNTGMTNDNDSITAYYDLMRETGREMHDCISALDAERVRVSAQG